MTTKLVTTFFSFFICSLFAFAQEQYKVKYLTTLPNDKELAKLYDSLQIPLLIVDNKVFILNAECFIRDAGGNSNDRNAGGNSNERNSGGNANDRNSGGNSNDRNAGGNSNDRNSGGNINDRNSGGNYNDRNADGNSNERNSGGEIGYFSCGNDAKGTLIIFFHNMVIDKKIKIYYNHKFYKPQKNIFKLKKS